MSSSLRSVTALAVVVAGVLSAAVACDSFSSEEQPPPTVDGGGGSDAPSLDDSSTPIDGATCTDTLNDPKNCGTCGHDCLGGACTAGKCQAAVLATTTEPVPFLTLDATRVIWATSLPTLGSAGKLYACPKAGGCGTAPITLASPYKNGALASDGTTAYVSNVLGGSSPGLEVIGPNGPQRLPGPDQNAILWIFPTSKGFFVNVSGEGDALARSIYQADIVAGGYTLVAKYTGPVNTEPTTVVNDHIYIGGINIGSLQAAYRSNGTFKEVLAGTYIGSLTNDGVNVYFTDSFGGGIYSCLGDGNDCLRSNVIAAGAGYAGKAEVVYAADGLLFFMSSGGDLRSCEPASCGMTLKEIGHENALATEWHREAFNIAVDQQAIYYVAREGSADAGEGGLTYIVKRIAREPK